jgi:hypothetical protein
MADPSADIILRDGARVSRNPKFVNFKSTVNATAREGGVDVELTGTREIAVKDTASTNAISVFGTAGLPYAITITGAFVVSQDTTAGNITVENPTATVVCTIAKGTTAGALVGATTLANTAVAAGTNLVVKSSSAGVARVFITYTRA